MLFHVLRHSRDERYQHLLPVMRRQFFAPGYRSLIVGAALLDVAKVAFEEYGDPLALVGNSFTAFLAMASAGFLEIAIAVSLTSAIRRMARHGVLDDLLLAGYRPREILAPLYGDLFCIMLAAMLVGHLIHSSNSDWPSWTFAPDHVIGVIHCVAWAALASALYLAMAVAGIWVVAQVAVAFGLAFAVMNGILVASDYLGAMLGYYFGMSHWAFVWVDHLATTPRTRIAPMTFGLYGGYLASLLVWAVVAAVAAALISRALPRLLARRVGG